jgi:hypothetical protein
MLVVLSGMDTKTFSCCTLCDPNLTPNPGLFPTMTMEPDLFIAINKEPSPFGCRGWCRARVGVDSRTCLNQLKQALIDHAMLPKKMGVPCQPAGLLFWRHTRVKVFGLVWSLFVVSLPLHLLANRLRSDGSAETHNV